jgi:protein-tyrosine phosphatase
MATPHVCEYLCVPTLDALTPSDSIARQAIDRIARSDGPVYIHCAQGHGRSAAFAAAVLIRRGLARDVEEAERLLVTKRPGVRLNRRQREFVRRVTQTN